MSRSIVIRLLGKTHISKTNCAHKGNSYMKDNLILAISVGHNSSAALMRNGEIVTAALEERFCRQKNHVGCPKLAIDYCLQKMAFLGINWAELLIPQWTIRVF